jgi:hypothetical protein
MSVGRFESVGEGAALLSRLAIRPKVRWLKFLLDRGIDDVKRAEQSFLASDIELTSEPVEALAAIGRIASYTLGFPVVLQADEIVDVRLPEVARFDLLVSATPTLKLLLNDARTLFAGLLRDPLEGLSVASAGVKLRLAAGTVAHYGVFMLDAANTTVLGGSSPPLVAQRNAYVSAGANRAVFEANTGAAAGKTPPDFVWTWPETRFVARRQRLDGPIRSRVSSEPPAGQHDIEDTERSEQPKAAPLQEPPRRGLPQFRPNPPRVRVLQPGDLHALPAAPHVQRVHVNARVSRVELRFDGARFRLGATLAQDVFVPVKESLARLLIGADPAVWAALPEFAEQERIRALVEPRICALEPPLLVIDRGIADPANRFELTTGEHERNATRS